MTNNCTQPGELSCTKQCPRMVLEKAGECLNSVLKRSWELGGPPGRGGGRFFWGTIII